MSRAARRLRRRGAGLRDRQPEGRRGQDHDDPDRGPRAGRPRASGCCSSTSTPRPASRSRSASSPKQCTPTLHDVLLQRVKADDAIVDAGRVRLLAGQHRPRRLRGAPPRRGPAASTRLRRALDTGARPYDTVLIDCPPSLGVLTVNGLTAADEVLVPLQCEALSHRGVAAAARHDRRRARVHQPAAARARRDRDDVRRARGRHAREVLDDVQTAFGLTVLEPPIPKTVRFAEAPGRGVSILEHAPQLGGRQGVPRDRRRCCTPTSRGRRNELSGYLRDVGTPARACRRAIRWARPRSFSDEPDVGPARSWSSAALRGVDAHVVRRLRARRTCRSRCGSRRCRTSRSTGG